MLQIGQLLMTEKAFDLEVLFSWHDEVGSLHCIDAQYCIVLSCSKRSEMFSTPLDLPSPLTLSYESNVTALFCSCNFL